jgi:hypothetical protein
MSYLGSSKHKNAVVLGGKTRAKQLEELKNKNISTYSLAPTMCGQCGMVLEYERRRNKFCSSSCSAKHNNTGREISTSHRRKVSESLRRSTEIRVSTESRKCNGCGKSFVVKVSSKKRYCESKCYSTSPEGRAASSIGGKVGGQISASKQQRRSKNEMLFAEKCKEHFSDILENTVMFGGWDADVIIPSKRIAVLWNGNWHREKLRNGHSVAQVQTRDTIKKGKIQEFGYVAYVIEDYGKYNPTFVESEFQKFLKFVG